MSDNLNFIVIPLDDRPVTYSLPLEISSINSNINVFLPPREYLGNLEKYADVEKILEWLKVTTENNKIDYIICSLDTLVYGGLIPSRRMDTPLNHLINDVEKIKSILYESKQKSNSKIYAFSSIMRISNNNINEEEKLYWDEYGEFIYQYSYFTHKYEATEQENDLNELEAVSILIPEPIIEDYIKTRERNFDINKKYLNFITENIVDYLVYSLDDTGQFGFNVKESKYFENYVKNNLLEEKVSIKTGADEIALSLFSKAITKESNEVISIHPVYSTEKGKSIISKYEDKTIENSVKGQIELAGCHYTDNAANMIILVHTPSECQNDHAMRVYCDKSNNNSVEFCLNTIKNTEKPIILIDISHANGGDSELVKELINQNLLHKLYSYSGWNTTGNTLGSAIFTAVNRYISETNNTYNDTNFKKCLLVRLADDWAYQAIVRQEIRDLTEMADIELLKEKLLPYINLLAKSINLNNNSTELTFPWKRTFEVEINVK
ncbi:MAG: DUF4127 family protein [bacterium]